MVQATYFTPEERGQVKCSIHRQLVGGVGLNWRGIQKLLVPVLQSPLEGTSHKLFFA